MVFGRVGSQVQRAQWYVKGSYVLDFVLKTSHADDCDLFYTGNRPTNNEVLSWIQDNGLPDPPSDSVPIFASHDPDDIKKFVRNYRFDIHPTESLTRPDGGGEMIFNVDCWYIPMDGVAKVYDPATGASAASPTGGPGTLCLIDPSRAVQAEPALKGLMKMLLYPSLRNLELAAKLVADASEDLRARPCDTSEAEQAIKCLDEMLRGLCQEDAGVARNRSKSAQVELAGR